MSDEHVLGAELVTPEGVRFAGAAAGVVLRTSEGDLTVLAGHTALTGDLAPTVVRVDLSDGGAESFVVHGGFVRVVTEPGAAADLLDGGTDERRTRVTVLAGTAEALDDLDIERATAAKAKAEAALAAISGEGEAAEAERADLESAVSRATLRLDAAAGRVAAGDVSRRPS